MPTQVKISDAGTNLVGKTISFDRDDSTHIRDVVVGTHAEKQALGERVGYAVLLKAFRPQRSPFQIAVGELFADWVDMHPDTVITIHD